MHFPCARNSRVLKTNYKENLGKTGWNLHSRNQEYGSLFMWQIQQDVKEKANAKNKRIGDLFPKSIFKKNPKKQNRKKKKNAMKPFSCCNRMQKQKAKEN